MSFNKPTTPARTRGVLPNRPDDIILLVYVFQSDADQHQPCRFRELASLSLHFATILPSHSMQTTTRNRKNCDAQNSHRLKTYHMVGPCVLRFDETRIQ